jgi:hypothetical protein
MKITADVLILSTLLAPRRASFPGVVVSILCAAPGPEDAAPREVTRFAAHMRADKPFSVVAQRTAMR